MFKDCYTEHVFTMEELSLLERENWEPYYGDNNIENVESAVISNPPGSDHWDHRFNYTYFRSTVDERMARVLYDYDGDIVISTLVNVDLATYFS
jgi:hypothetical protein